MTEKAGRSGAEVDRDRIDSGWIAALHAKVSARANQATRELARRRPTGRPPGRAPLDPGEPVGVAPAHPGQLTLFDGPAPGPRLPLGVRRPRDKPRAQPGSGRLVLLAGLAVATAAALWLTAGVWGDRLPPGQDSAGHFVLTRFAVESLFPSLRPNGWSPHFMLGFEALLFLGPGLAMAVAAVKVLSLGLLSTAGAYKVVVIGSFVALPAAFAFLARSFGLNRRAAGIAAVAVLAVNSPFGGAGLAGLFSVGLIPHQLGAIGFCLTLGCLLRLAADPGPRWVLATAASLAATLLTHARTPMILAVLGATGLALTLVEVAVRRAVDQRRGRSAPVVARRRRFAPANGPVFSRRLLVHLAAAGALALGLAAFYMVPVLVHRDLQGPLAGWGVPPFGERVGEIWRGDLVFRRPAVLALGAASVLCLGRVLWRRPWALAMALTPITFLALAHWAYGVWPDNVIVYQLPVRGLGYAALLAVLPLAAGLAWLTSGAGKVGDASAVAIAFMLAVAPIDSWRDAATQMPVAVPQMEDAAAQLSVLVPEGARFATERDFPGEIGNTNIIHPDRWLGWRSGRNTLNIFSIESSIAAGTPSVLEQVKEIPPTELADSLARLGVTHLVTLSDTARNRLAGHERFDQFWTSAPLAIFGVRPAAGRPEPASLVSAPTGMTASLVSAKADRVEVSVDAAAATTVSVAVGWSPKWHATVGGRGTPVGRTADGLITVDVPAGPSTIVLEFRPDGADRVGSLITLATAAGCGAYVWRRRRGRDGGRGASGPGAGARLLTRIRG